jgi:hypothetical protein
MLCLYVNFHISTYFLPLCIGILSRIKPYVSFRYKMPLLMRTYIKNLKINYRHINNLINFESGCKIHVTTHKWYNVELLSSVFKFCPMKIKLDEKCMMKFDINLLHLEKLDTYVIPHNMNICTNLKQIKLRKPTIDLVKTNIFPLSLNRMILYNEVGDKFEFNP